MSDLKSKGYKPPVIWSYSHNNRGVLFEAHNVVVNRDLYATDKLSFIYSRGRINNNAVELESDGIPVESAKYTNLINENIVEFDDDFYIIKIVRDQFVGGNIRKQVECFHMSYEFADAEVFNVNFLTTDGNNVASPSDVINAVLQNSNLGVDNGLGKWEIGTIDPLLSSLRREFKFEQKSGLICLREIAEKFEGTFTYNISWDSNNSKWVKKINLIKDFTSTGTMIRYDNNMKEIEVESDSSNIKTHIRVLGRDKITFATQPTETRTDNGYTYNWHTSGDTFLVNYKYFLSQGYTLTDVQALPRKEMTIDEQFTTDESTLYTRAKSKSEEFADPRISYTTKVLDLYWDKPDEWKEFKVGERVKIYHKQMNVFLNAQIVKLSRNYDKPQDTIISIANYRINWEHIFETNTKNTQDIYNVSGIKYGDRLGESTKIERDTGVVLAPDGTDNRAILGRYATDKFGLAMGDLDSYTFEYNLLNNTLNLLNTLINITRDDNKIRILLDATNGFKIQRNTETNPSNPPVWQDTFAADTEGNLVTDIAKVGGLLTVGDGDTSGDIFLTDNSAITSNALTNVMSIFNSSGELNITANNDINISTTNGNVNIDNIELSPKNIIAEKFEKLSLLPPDPTISGQTNENSIIEFGNNEKRFFDSKLYTESLLLTTDYTSLILSLYRSIIQSDGNVLELCRYFVTENAPTKIDDARCANYRFIKKNN